MAIEMKNLTREYKRGQKTFRAVNGVSLVVSPGDFINIIGRSGSGKSTLLNMAAALLAPTLGQIEVDGRSIAAWSDAEASAYRNSQIGYIPQGQRLLASLTVLDNVRLPFYFAKREEGDSAGRAQELLEQVGIGHLAAVYPKQLSGGEAKRVAVARALINRPQYLFADEPTSNLDVQTTAEIMKLLKAIAENGTAVVMVTHELDLLSGKDRTFVMEAGVLAERAG